MSEECWYLVLGVDGEDAAVDGGEGAGTLGVVITVSTDHLRGGETGEETCCEEPHRDDGCSALAERNYANKRIDIEASCIWDKRKY